MAFQAAAKGKSNRQVAQTMNGHGFRTVGTRGGGPFTKDTVRGILRNRFYIGEIPDGKGGRKPAKHNPIIDPSLFNQVQAARARKRRGPLPMRRSATTYSLSGLTSASNVKVPCGFTGTILVAPASSVVPENKG